MWAGQTVSVSVSIRTEESEMYQEVIGDYSHDAPYTV